MKRISLVAACAVSLMTLSAESVTITHVTAGDFANELTACGTEVADITELTVVGDAAMNATDFKAIRTSLAETLTKLDISSLTFANNRLPGDEAVGGTTAGVLENMTALVECKVPETLQGFMAKAFAGCKNLTTLNMPDGVTIIHQQTFQNCSSLNVDKLPAALKEVRANAFENCTSLTVSELPAGVTRIMGRGFSKASVTFSELPEGLTTLGEYAFSGSSIEIKTLPSTLTTLGTYVFQSCKGITDFTIPDVCNLWTKIPDATFWVDPNTYTRTFTCRAPEPPTARFGKFKGDWSDEWAGVFGKGNDNQTFPNITFKVLASAMESYKATGPYNTMKRVALTTPVQAPVVDIDGGNATKCAVTLYVADGPESYKDFKNFTEEVYEGKGHFTFEVTSAEGNNEAFYIETVRYLEPEAYAEGDEEAEDPTDQNLLYAATGDIKNLVDQPVTVPVTVEPGMKQLYVKVSNAYYFLTGVEAVDTPANTVRRVGDTVYTTLPGAQLYDLAGRMVASTASNTIDLSGLPAGTYILRAGNTTKKILK